MKPGSSGAAAASRSRRHSWWWWGRHVLTLAFLVVVIAVLAQQMGKVDWARVGQSLRAYPAGVLPAAAALTVASHLLFGAFDQLGRLYTRARLTVWQVAAVAGVSYVFTLNLGALLGGMGFRYRLYARLGLSTPTITKIYALSVLTNWLGYAWMLGAVLLWRAMPLPPRWHVNPAWMTVLGAALWLLAGGYVAACALARRRTWTVRGVAVELPSGRMAVAQSLLSMANWLVMGWGIYVMLQARVPFVPVLGVLLASGVIGGLTHMPAGLGVLEAVFLTMLGGRMPAYELLAGVLAYRVVYYLCPLAVALAGYAALEAWTARRRRRAVAGAGPQRRAGTG